MRLYIGVFPSSRRLLFSAFSYFICSAAPSGAFRVDVKLIDIEPEFVNWATRASGGRAYPAGGDFADFFISSRYLRANCFTFYGPVVNLATSGTGVKSYSSGISSTGVVIISICSSSSGPTSNSYPPTFTVFGTSFYYYTVTFWFTTLLSVAVVFS